MTLEKNHGSSGYCFRNQYISLTTSYPIVFFNKFCTRDSTWLRRTIDDDQRVASRETRLADVNPISECYPFTMIRRQTNIASRCNIPHSDAQGDASCYSRDIDVSRKLPDSCSEMCHYRIPRFALFPRRRRANAPSISRLEPMREGPDGKRNRWRSPRFQIPRATRDREKSRA